VARYFVTGATGFIGRRLARQLVEAGHQVVALVRQPSRAGELSSWGVQLAQGDITEPDSLREPMRGADGVFHVAGWYHIGARDRSAGQQVNIEGTRNVLRAMAELGVPRGVYTSTLAVFGDTHGVLADESYVHHGPWLSEYDRTKWVAHYEVALPMIRQGLPLVIVQPGAVYGPGDPSALGQTLRQYLRGRLLAIPRRTAFCWGHVEDTARAHLLAMQRGEPGQAYITAGPAHTLREALAIAATITHIAAPRLEVAPGVLRGLASLIGRIERRVPLPDGFSAEYLRVAAGVTYLGSSDRARRELGLQMRPLAEGLRETLSHERAHRLQAPGQDQMLFRYSTRSDI
jgi:nucleoside-diphosphate-sugar epimerase